MELLFSLLWHWLCCPTFIPLVFHQNDKHSDGCVPWMCVRTSYIHYAICYTVHSTCDVWLCNIICHERISDVLGWNDPIVCLCTAHTIWCIAVLSSNIVTLFCPFLFTRYTQARCRSRVMILLLLLLLLLPFIFVHVFVLCTYIALFRYAVSKVRAFHVFNTIWMYVEILLVTSVRRILEGKQIKCNPKNIAKEKEANSLALCTHKIYAESERVTRVRKQWIEHTNRTNTERKYLQLFGEFVKCLAVQVKNTCLQCKHC